MKEKAEKIRAMFQRFLDNRLTPEELPLIIGYEVSENDQIKFKMLSDSKQRDVFKSNQLKFWKDFLKEEGVDPNNIISIYTILFGNRTASLTINSLMEYMEKQGMSVKKEDINEELLRSPKMRSLLEKMKEEANRSMILNIATKKDLFLYRAEISKPNSVNTAGEIEESVAHVIEEFEESHQPIENGKNSHDGSVVFTVLQKEYPLV